MSSYILGLSCYYHDSAAALLKDGDIISAAQEERFSRKKHDSSFPKNAVSYCLKSQGISLPDVNKIVYYEKPLHQQTAYKNYPTVKSLEASETLSKTVLSLPMSPSLDFNDLLIGM